MRNTDVIIAGAGPAGAAAAAVLGRAGVRALLLDKAAFPRRKLCAGLFTWKTVKAVERIFGHPIQTLIDQGVVNHVSHGYRIRHRGAVLTEGPLIYPFHFVSRLDFDAWCARQAAGVAELVENQSVTRAVAESATVHTRDGQTFQGRYLIGADGALSQVRRGFSLDPEAWRRYQGMGAEMSIPRSWLEGRRGLHEDLLADFPTIYAGFYEAGYAWTFPHRHEIIIGLGGLYKAAPGRFQAVFDEFTAFLGLPKHHGLTASAHPLPYGNWLKTPFQGRTLLAGDAAGIVEPLLGEGIYYALRSGELAAQACLRALRDGRDPGPVYADSLARLVYPELVWSKRLRHWLYWLASRDMVGPVRLFLRGGGGKLQEMVHGMRSWKWLKKRDPEDV